ncbi:glutamate receptor ionotropic, NMDA 2C, partial [Eurytemora carolleeae]|uniref:glutamate receptor ionotropic, NMDA 2C n=1 Tax=Eurytemora carolleeae TaxID=1294199 RepID=UPI000C76FDD5
MDKIWDEEGMGKILYGEDMGRVGKLWDEEGMGKILDGEDMGRVVKKWDEEGMGKYWMEKIWEEWLRYGMKKETKNGMNAGRTNGMNAGRKNGMNAGRKNGMNKRRKNGMNEGRKNGMNERRKNGMNEGRKNGMNEGWKNGMNERMKNGMNERRKNGMNERRKNGMNEGRKNGMNERGNNGMNEGWKNVMKEGRKNGINERRKNGMNERRKNGMNERRKNGMNGRMNEGKDNRINYVSRFINSVKRKSRFYGKQGVPEKFSMKITFLEEPPFIIVSEPDPVSGRCSMNRGVACLTRSVENEKSENETLTRMCCSGLLIDLLRKFEDDLGFNYDLIRVDDPKWGTLENGKWNGLMGVLVNKKTDMVLSSLKISREREKDVDFTVPFLESGIAIVVAKRTGIISPTAFLEPFDINSWMLVVLVAVQAAALSIFIFEWLSPAGYDMKVLPTKTGHRFSLFRTYWLVCAVLFQASVQVDCPRGLTSRFMSSIWALFAVVFLAIYTANLAAFMIPRKEYHDLTGLTDSRISNPQSHKPPLKFTTLPYSHAYVTLQKYHAEVYDHIKSNKLIFNTSEHAVQAVKEG